MNERFPKLNFPPVTLRVRDDRQGLHVWDALRGCWLPLTPEEWVRRHLVAYLVNECGAGQALISQEFPILLEGMRQRADVVVSDSSGRPLLLAECKAPGVEISAQVYAQAVRYNTVAGARYLLITNGISHFIWERTEEDEYLPLSEFPRLDL